MQAPSRRLGELSGFESFLMEASWKSFCCELSSYLKDYGLLPSVTTFKIGLVIIYQDGRNKEGVFSWPENCLPASLPRINEAKAQTSLMETICMLTDSVFDYSSVRYSEFSSRLGFVLACKLSNSASSQHK